jgi:lipoprotein-releasing system permease protein|tara:strand:+ start:1110 stop:2336 length:1227 start_codon:yes stop_codon:yes gene_type:complete
LNVSTFIAKRYFTTSKKKNFIQVLSWISMIGVAIGTMALIVVLSVFNGLGDVLRSVYHTYDADLKVVPKTGKSFSLSEEQLKQIRELNGVSSLSRIIEDNAVAVYRDKQAVVQIRGVEESFMETGKLDSFLWRGKTMLREQDQEYAVLGAGLSAELGILIESDFYRIELIYPRNLRPGALPSTNSVRRLRVKPSGIVSIDAAIDERLMVVSYPVASRLLDYDNRYTALELYLKPEANTSRIEQQVASIIGEEYSILDSDEQHGDLMRAVKIEKLFAYIALSFITLIASFNIFFSLSMLAIEKRRDMAILFAVGATHKIIRQIFLKQGIIIAFVGAIFGLVLGLSLCYLQDRYGLVGLGMANAVVSAYPVKVVWTDVLLVTFSITLITMATAYRPAILASRLNPIEFLD